MSRIIVLEIKTKIKFEHVRMKTKNGDNDEMTNKGLTMVLECDHQKNRRKNKVCERK